MNSAFTGLPKTGNVRLPWPHWNATSIHCTSKWCPSMHYTKRTCMGCSLASSVCCMHTSREGLPYVLWNSTLDLLPGFLCYKSATSVQFLLSMQTHHTHHLFFISELLRRIGPAPEKILPCLWHSWHTSLTWKLRHLANGGWTLLCMLFQVFQLFSQLY